MVSEEEKRWSAKQKAFLNSLSSEDIARPIVGINEPKDKPAVYNTTATTIQDVTEDDDDDDPEEVDISQPGPSDLEQDFESRKRMMREMMANPPSQFGDRQTGSSVPQDPFAALRQMQQEAMSRGPNGQTAMDPNAMMNPFAMLQQMQANADAGGSGSFLPPGGSTGDMPDPMEMMNQMLTGLMGSQGANGMPDPRLANGNAASPFPSMMGAGPQGKRPMDPITRLWKIIHAAAMVLLLLYLSPASIPLLPSSGNNATVYRSEGQPIFWLFITVELVLQSTRLFIYGPDRTSSSPNIAVLSQFLPPPYNDYLMLGIRYFSIFTTLRDDFCLLMIGLLIRSVVSTYY